MYVLEAKQNSDSSLSSCYIREAMSILIFIIFIIHAILVMLHAINTKEI